MHLEVSKKLVYLDQSFLSDAWQAMIKPGRIPSLQLQILEKLRQLKKEKKIFVVVSYVHAAETSAIPNKFVEQRAGIWRLANELAEGIIVDATSEVFVKQQRRRLQNRLAPEIFPPEDIGLTDSYRYHTGGPFILTNTWRIRMHQQTAPVRDKVNTQLRAILERQTGEMQTPKISQDCLAHVRQCWRKALLDGIYALRQQEADLAFFQKYSADPSGLKGYVPEFSSASLKFIIGQIVQGLGSNALDDLTNLLAQDVTGGSVWVRLSSALEAEVLWSWLSSDRTRPNFKDAKFGLSRLNDINHISTYLPYVDALTTDNDMARLCQRDMVKKELERIAGKIFSTETYTDFDAWLEALIA